MTEPQTSENRVTDAERYAFRAGWTFGIEEATKAHDGLLEFASATMTLAKLAAVDPERMETLDAIEARLLVGLARVRRLRRTEGAEALYLWQMEVA